MAIDQELFREIMSAFPTGVAIVTAGTAEPKGLTLSAFSPVSLDPPLVLVCIDKTSNTLPAIQSGGGFTVNLLRAGREELAQRFASKAEDKFAGLRWERPAIEEAGPILVDDTVAHVCCKVYSSLEAGDHWIFVGSVDAGERDATEVPLIYGHRTYTTWQELTS
jgi:flavin reductase (DIM6/NTAB) family NADH-FMN oxidoreductase RutF